MKDKFTEDDVKTMVEFLNDVAKNYVCKEVSIPEMSKHISLYKKAQGLIAKMEANIFEIKQIIEPAEEVKEE